MLLADQDGTQLDQELIHKGQLYLNRPAESAHASEYYPEAGIAILHCTASSYEAIDWLTVLHYYDLLLAHNPSPVVALHRAVALINVEGPTAAIGEVVALSGLDNNQYYHAILGDLYQRNGQPEPARQHYQRAWHSTSSTTEQELLPRKLNTFM